MYILRPNRDQLREMQLDLWTSRFIVGAKLIALFLFPFLPSKTDTAKAPIQHHTITYYCIAIKSQEYLVVQLTQLMTYRLKFAWFTCY